MSALTLLAIVLVVLGIAFLLGAKSTSDRSSGDSEMGSVFALIVFGILFVLLGIAAAGGAWFMSGRVTSQREGESPPARMASPAHPTREVTHG